MTVQARHALRRVVVEGVTPEVDGGRFAVKRAAGEPLVVEADVFADGHDELACVLRHRREAEAQWTEVAMEPLGNDRWRASFVPEEPGAYRYTVEGWVDRFGTWRRDIRKWLADGQDVSAELEVGADIIAAAARRAAGTDRQRLRAAADAVRDAPARVRASGVSSHPALSDELAELAGAYPDRRHATPYARELELVVDRVRSRFSAWYELFPRSWSPDATRHGTLRDVAGRLGHVERLGFDVLYLPPVHPIGAVHRKGPNNRRVADEGDPGSPWAIADHKALHPQLGTFGDFDALVSAASARGIDVALDIAFQCAPDHPWPREHPEWFRRLPDGSIRYAENPPKRYEDIYPVNFETADWRALWDELLGVFTFWMDHGVRVFRVDNPHTKSFAFWEWAIAELRRRDPGVLLLSEAFTRPRVMYRLAKLGFSQSYTYFAWRNEKREIEEYFTELTRTGVREYFRPNLWPNTPDILTEYLQAGGEPAFRARLVLAATLGASYGMYGPAFELCENVPREAGSEEYLHSEKYEVRPVAGGPPPHPKVPARDIDSPRSLAPLVAQVNRVRRENPALQHDWSLRFLPVDNEHLVAYSKRHGGNLVVVVVNVDARWAQSGWLELSEEEAGADEGEGFVAHDLLGGERYSWEGSRHFVLLEPGHSHVLRIERQPRDERRRP